MSLRFLRCLAALSLALALPVMAKTVATVNGKAISSVKVDAFMKQLAAHGQPDTPELRKMITDQLVMREVLMQEAARKKIPGKANVKLQIENARENIIINTLREDYLRKHPVSDADIRKEYDSYKQMVGDTEYRVRHILVATEDEAKGILAQLKEGASFDDLAKEKSKDKVSAQKGGDIDWGHRGKYVKPFSEAMVKLSKGQYTEAPVQSDFGYHIIKLEDTRPMTFPDFDEVKPQVAKALAEQRVKAYFDGLFKKAKVK
jgi:peptidyl-prolyl cis-trans isomerase C